MKVNQRNIHLRTAAERQRHDGGFEMKFRNTTGNEKVRDKGVQKGNGGGRGWCDGGTEGDTEGEVGRSEWRR